MKSKNTRIIVELIAWAILFAFPLVLFPGFLPIDANGSINIVFIGLSITNVSLISFYYFNSYFLIPKFYFPKKYFTYVICLAGYMLIVISVLQLKKEFNPLPSPPFRFANATFIASIVIRFVMLFLLSLGISSYSRMKSAEQEKIKAELSFLKAQINPHFLFNTLNSIYALTVKKSDSAPESITKLSSIMRYVITDAAQDFVSLEKELAYVSNYVELEKFRLTQKINLEYKVTGNFLGKEIAPLIFIPFIENAFKHGVSTQENSSISILITLEKNQLHLLVKNTKLKSRSSVHENTGLGIENTKQRLSLLYPGKHELHIKDNADEFSVDLKITLND
jgi:hypothetical protein